MRIRWYVLFSGLFALGVLLAGILTSGLFTDKGSAGAVSVDAAPAGGADAPPALSAPTPPPGTEGAGDDPARTELLAEIRLLLPKRLDRLTTFADARHADGRFTFVFLFPFLKAEVDAAQLASILKDKVRTGFCTDPYVQRIFGLGEGIDLIFHSAEGLTVYEQALDAPDCG